MYTQILQNSKCLPLVTRVGTAGRARRDDLNKNVNKQFLVLFKFVFQFKMWFILLTENTIYNNEAPWQTLIAIPHF